MSSPVDCSEVSEKGKFESIASDIGVQSSAISAAYTLEGPQKEISCAESDGGVDGVELRSLEGSHINEGVSNQDNLSTSSIENSSNKKDTDYHELETKFSTKEEPNCKAVEREDPEQGELKETTNDDLEDKHDDNGQLEEKGGSCESTNSDAETENVMDSAVDGHVEKPNENKQEKEESMETDDQLMYPAIQYNFAVTPEQVTGVWGEFDLSSNFLKGCKCGTAVQGLTEMASVLKMPEGETIYDYCWYPYMSSLDPDTCCLLSSCRDHPIHMWDAFTGAIRCTYTTYNHLDEVVAANCVSFNLDGSQIYCGFNKMLRVFDTARPGRNFQERPTVVKKEGQTGIISSIAFSPDNSGLYALGSYSKSVGVYSDTDGGQLVFLLQGQQGGVTHVLFSPDGTKLYSGGRKDDEILCWDVRNPGAVLYCMMRSVDTNQRVYFDIDRSGQYIISGNADGTVAVWDSTLPPTSDDTTAEATLQPVMKFIAHGDFVNGASFHPSLPLLATSSGQRQFELLGHCTDDEESMEQDSGVQVDNSLRIWAAGEQL
ncbi:Telomerase Cajal body protein 1 [Acropora cervicornis]|uniref:WD repeat-containing protein 79 n=1 Tax=Acropora cervicornis TaxID=6130 RepID=A0AAD9R5Z9_ACRCE|nr:Telomerase Cajal body protein 1 [Acropora cervicornis]